MPDFLVASSTSATLSTPAVSHGTGPAAGRGGADSIRSMPMRSRRTTLAVPASNPRFIAKARELPVDEFFLDLEDAVAPAAKDEARENAVAALNDGGWGDRVRVVRVNDVATP